MSYTYRYFRDPHSFSYYSPEPKCCSLCKLTRAGYDGPYYGLEDIRFVCEPCLHSGALHSVECTANEADPDALLTALIGAHGDEAPTVVAQIVASRTAEVEERTPHKMSWQDSRWPVHCAGYCCFEKEAGQLDFERLDRSGDAKRFFIDHLHPDYRNTDLDVLWDSLRPDSPVDQSVAYDLSAYLFTCLECGTIVVTWDAS